MMNPKQTPPSIKKTDYASMLLGSVAAGFVTGAATLWLSWHDLPWLPAPAEPLLAHAEYWLKGALFHLSHGHFYSTAWPEYLAYLDRLSSQGNDAIINFRVKASILSGTVAALYSGWKLAAPRDALIHMRGRQFYQGGEAIRLANQESRTECNISGKGILIHPKIPMSQDRESRHILVMGAIGAGKSQVIWHLLNQVMARGDRAIIYDNKGEFTESIKHGILFAPWDKRSYAWDIARDCCNKQDAKEFAARLIPTNDKDPMWSNASRAILTGMIVSLQVSKKTEWGFRDLANLIPLLIEEIRSIMEQYNQEGLRSVEEASKTTQSILINLSAFMSVIFDLADAWENLPKERRFSIRAWLGNKTQGKVLVLQGNDSYKQLAHAYINLMVSSMSGMVGSPGYENSKTRKIWMFLDELPQLGKLDNLASLMEAGRSKGIRVVIGTQDVSQIRGLYGEDGMKTWTSMFGTTIYGRVAGGETAKWISERIGDRDVERPNETWSNQNGQPTCSISYTSEKIRLVTPSQLQSELGEGDKHVIMILDAFRKGVYQVIYPWVELTKFRKPHIPAAWLQSRGQPASGHATNIADEATAVAATSSDDKPDQARRKFKRRDGPDIELQPEGSE